MTSDETTKRWTVRALHDLIWVRAAIIRQAMGMGFSRQEAWQLGTAVSELMTNAIKFANGGTVTLEVTTRELTVVVDDEGPGIADVPMALRDGYSEGTMIEERLARPESPDVDKRQGLGAGLGAVQRLMDAVIIENKATGGLRVCATKRLKK